MEKNKDIKIQDFSTYELTDTLLSLSKYVSSYKETIDAIIAELKVRKVFDVSK